MYFHNPIQTLFLNFHRHVERRLTARLETFAEALQAWMTELAEHFTPNWRERWTRFLADREAEGERLHPDSKRAIEDWIEQAARSVGASATSEQTAASTENDPYRPFLPHPANPRLQYRLPTDSTLTEADVIFAREIAVVTRALKHAIRQKTAEMESPGVLARLNPFGPDRLTLDSELATLTLQYSQLSLMFIELGYQQIEWATLGDAPGAGLDVAEAAEDRAAPEAGLLSVFIEDAMNLSLAGSLTKLGAKLLLRGTARLGVRAGEAVGLIGHEAVVDKSWKTIIVGNAQKTHTPGHQFRSYREAIRMAKSGEYDQVWLNRAYSTTTGVRTSPRRLPDVIGRRKTGQFDAIEVPSKSNYRPELWRRNRDAMGQLPAEQQGEIMVTDILKAK